MKKILLLFILPSFSSFAGTPAQVAIGDNHFCTLFQDGSLQCWGANDSGQLGLGNSDSQTNPVRVPIAAGKKVTQIAAAGSNTCAIFDDNNLKCWGDNSNGQLGLGVSNPSMGTQATETIDKIASVDLGTSLKAAKIVLSGSDACVLFQDGSLKCWGDNSSGQLGLGDTNSRGTDHSQMGTALPFINLGTGVRALDVKIAPGYACALLQVHSLKCWGNVPLDFSVQKPVGGSPTDMGDNLKPLSFGTGARLIQIATGPDLFCALLDDGTVKCFGDDSAASVGELAGNSATIQMGDSLKPVLFGAGLQVLSITVGSSSACVLMENNALKCWGNNSNGQLGLGDTLSRGVSFDDMGDNLPFVNLGRFSAVQSMAVNGAACAILRSGDVKCWGIGNTGGTPGSMGDQLAPIPFVR